MLALVAWVSTRPSRKGSPSPAARLWHRHDAARSPCCRDLVLWTSYGGDV